MESLPEIEALVAFEGRGPGTDSERRAAGHLERRLLDLGREAHTEPVDAWPAWHATHALHALAAVVGSALAVGNPALGAAIVLAAAVLTVGDAAGAFLLTRRLTGRRASQNVVSADAGDKPGALVLVAHYDAGRGGIAFDRRLAERRAVLSRMVRRPISSFALVPWSMVAVLGCAVLRLIGLEGTVLSAVQFVPTVLLILGAALLADMALSPVVPGANDNGSGVVTALRLAERHGGGLRNFDLWVLLTGSHEALAQGMRSFLRRHRHDLEKDRTVFLNLDELGVGTVRYTRRKGLIFTAGYNRQLVDLCAEIAEDDEDGQAFGARPIIDRSPSDAYAARYAGYPAVTVTCRNALDYVP
ncbi:MAG TPA: M28 family peptidase, partial [Chloroflexota bacterium]|nr:M28 family peptidase [Chloroflexota bacterium]